MLRDTLAICLPLRPLRGQEESTFLPFFDGNEGKTQSKLVGLALWEVSGSQNQEPKIEYKLVLLKLFGRPREIPAKIPGNPAKIGKVQNGGLANGGLRYLSTIVHDCLRLSSFCDESPPQKRASKSHKRAQNCRRLCANCRECP